MGTLVTVKQEDTSDTIQASPFAENEAIANLSDSGWVCRQAVLTKDGKNIVIEGDVTIKDSTDMYFEATLAPNDTRQLDNRQYKWIIEVENTTVTPPYRKEHEVDLDVEKHSILDIAQTSYDYDFVAKVSATEVKIDVASLPGGTIRSIKLLDVDGVIIQTTGWVSDTVDDSQVVLTLLEPMIADTPVQVRVNI